MARAQIAAPEKALDQYRLENRRYPSAEEGLAAIGPYLRKAVPNDPWGRPYQYRAGPRATSSCSPTAATARPAAAGTTPT